MPATSTRTRAFELIFRSYFDEEFTPLPEEGVPPRASSLFLAVREHQPELDELISKKLKKGWTLERITKEARAALSLALFELLHKPKTPKTTAINEAVELIKLYGADEDYKFVNKILDEYAAK